MHTIIYLHATLWLETFISCNNCVYMHTIIYLHATLWLETFISCNNCVYMHTIIYLHATLWLDSVVRKSTQSLSSCELRWPVTSNPPPILIQIQSSYTGIKHIANNYIAICTMYNYILQIIFNCLSTFGPVSFHINIVAEQLQFSGSKQITWPG